MFKTLLVSLALIASSLAQATSLNPCTPNVEAMPTHMFCKSGSLHYSIVINTLMSPRGRGCEGPNYFEYKSAKVEVTDSIGSIVHKLNLGDSDFTYSLSGSGDSTFDVEALSLHLDHCVAPVHGGVSIGN